MISEVLSKVLQNCTSFEFLLVLFVLLLSIWYFKRERYSKPLPPGPFAWPFFGNVFWFRKGKMIDIFELWRKQHGDIFQFYLGSNRSIVISGYDNLREVLTKSGDDMLDRPILPVVKEVSKGMKGIVFSNGQRWRETRRFSLMAMKDFGLGRQSLQEKIVEETNALRNMLLSSVGKPIDLKPYFANAVSNVINSIVFGKRFDFEDPKFQNVVSAINRQLQRGGGNSLIMFFPWLRHLSFFNKGFRADQDIVESFIQEQIGLHRQAFDPKQPPRDFVDLYLQVESGNSDFDRAMFDEEHMYVIIRDLFVAGTETTATTLMWIVLFWILNPEVQERCREDILRVFGKDGEPSTSCRDDLPYFEATILEAQRMGDIAPFGVIRAPTRDIEIKGYTIPRGTRVVNFLHSAHNDPKKWPEPDCFRPQRFLDAEGRLIRHEQLIPFSAGRRNCIGENVAKTELFLFCASLLQQFRFALPAGAEKPSAGGVTGGTRIPAPYQVIVTRLE